MPSDLESLLATLADQLDGVPKEGASPDNPTALMPGGSVQPDAADDVDCSDEGLGELLLTLRTQLRPDGASAPSFPASFRDINPSELAVPADRELGARILQTDFTPGSGNALQACVASIFGRPLEAVPNFVTWRGGYLDGINEFVKTIPATDCTDHATVPDSGKVTAEKVIFPPGDSAAAELPAGELCILRGKSPRGDHGHVVVARIDAGGAPSEMVWDPHPDGTFLDNGTPPGWAMLFRRPSQPWTPDPRASTEVAGEPPVTSISSVPRSFRPSKATAGSMGSTKPRSVGRRRRSPEALQSEMNRWVGSEASSRELSICARFCILTTISLQRSVELLNRHSVPYAFPADVGHQHSTKFKLAGHTKGNTKNQRKQMRRQMQGTLEATIAHLKEIAVNAGITDRADAPGWDDGDRGCSAASGSSTDADDSDDEQHAAWLNEFVPSLSR